MREPVYLPPQIGERLPIICDDPGVDSPAPSPIPWRAALAIFAAFIAVGFCLGVGVALVAWALSWP